jgi:hypothetical protein
MYGATIGTPCRAVSRVLVAPSAVYWSRRQLLPEKWNLNETDSAKQICKTKMAAARRNYLQQRHEKIEFAP